MRLACLWWIVLWTLTAVEAQTTAGPVTPIVTGGTSVVTGGTSFSTGGTVKVTGGTTVIGGGVSAWTKVQDRWGPFLSSGTTITATFTSAPMAGNLVVCVMGFLPQQAPTSVQDNAVTPNTYTLTPASPSVAIAARAAVSLAYLVAPTGAGATITATAGTAIIQAEIGCAEYHKSAGTPALDVDAAGSGGGAGITVINTPSVTVAAAGELLQAGVNGNGGGCTTVNSPPAWVKFTTTPGSSNYCGAYVLSASAGSNALNFTQASGGTWNSMLAAFK